ncbi:MAG: DEAD/DEAH box helicase [Actinomycetota bacterium]|nr:DEAD/DEAH box helicase [Actinomycetota bacterium]
MSLEEFFARLPFPPDRFQLEAARAVLDGESVVVTAPTGAGKTLVAEAAVHLALEGGRRAFYTTPLKALSNQKYGDFLAHYGAARVGLLTGDNVVNGDADVVVMTTEVLRNMIYAREGALGDLGVVVLDEVHFLQDPFRGAVWEEIIIHLPRPVPLVCLSATVSNAEQFTEWVRERRGSTRLVLERHRPVPLENLYLLKDRHGQRQLLLLPTFVERGGRTKPNPEVARLLGRTGQRRRRFATPRRGETVEALAEQGMLPAIYFLFSRAGCEDAARQIVGDGIRLTTSEEGERILQYAELRTAHLDPTDLVVLGYQRWTDQLQCGVAPHHAGMVPAFKETVEELFARGLVKLVFATETLALGINMPAKSVVLESLSKFTGESHELLQPGDYTQLTGRAGRRGIDTRGYAVVLYSPYVPFDRAAGIAGAGSHPLRSSFRPTYNMAVNLVANYPQEVAEELLNASFAQFQREAGLEGLRRSLERNEEALAGYRRAAECERGDVWEYLGGQDQVGRSSRRKVMQEFARRTQAGDVLEVPEGRRGGRYVMLARGRTSEPRLLLLSSAGELDRLRPEELPIGTAKVGSITLPTPFQPHEAPFRDRVTAELRSFAAGRALLVAGEGLGGGDLHPVAGCPEVSEHVRWARRAQRMSTEVERLRGRLERAGKGLVTEFRSILDLLEEWGYSQGWSLTERGENLRFIYNEVDLLVAEAVQQRLFAALGQAEVAALASAFIYEPRSGVEARTWPTRELAARGDALMALWERLHQAEAARGLTESRPPQAGFAEFAYHWANGADLEDLLADDELAAGDFVRTCRQLLDLLRQLRDAFPKLAETAASSVKAIDRGVVAAGGIV